VKNISKEHITTSQPQMTCLQEIGFKGAKMKKFK